MLLPCMLLPCMLLPCMLLPWVLLPVRCKQHNPTRSLQQVPRLAHAPDRTLIVGPQAPGPDVIPNFSHEEKVRHPSCRADQSRQPLSSSLGLRAVLGSPALASA
jgi:hypothetical protein